MVDTTRSVRKGIVVRNILRPCKGRLLCEVRAGDLWALCILVKERSAAAFLLPQTSIAFDRRSWRLAAVEFARAQSGDRRVSTPQVPRRIVARPCRQTR